MHTLEHSSAGTCPDSPIFVPTQSVHPFPHSFYLEFKEGKKETNERTTGQESESLTLTESVGPEGRVGGV